MAENIEEFKKHIRGYWIVGGLLYVLTIITVSISYLHLAVVPSIILGLAVAVTKGTLVALFFMHLISEKQMIYWTLTLTAMFFVVLMSIPVAEYLDAYQGIIFK